MLLSYQKGIEVEGGAVIIFSDLFLLLLGVKVLSSFQPETKKKKRRVIGLCRILSTAAKSVTNSTMYLKCLIISLHRDIFYFPREEKLGGNLSFLSVCVHCDCFSFSDFCFAAAVFVSFPLSKCSRRSVSGVMHPGLYSA